MKFSIRDVLFATVIAALVLGWWIDRTRLASQVQALAQPQRTGSDTFELIVGGKDHDEELLFNPRTGEAWKRYSNGKWLPHAWTLAESQK
jgi:hypothetical protein